MYPLKTLLIGCIEPELSDLKREFTNLGVGVEGEFLDIRSCLQYILAHPSETRLLIVHPNCCDDVEQLARLNESLEGEPILASSTRRRTRR